MSISDLNFCRISLEDLGGDAPVQFVRQEGVATSRLLPEHIHLWLVNVDSGNRRLDELQPVLCEDERARATRFHFERDRNHYIVRRAILRQLIGQYLETDPREIEFNLNSFGKPELARASGNSALQFNLSTSEEWAMYVFARRRRLGIDIEKIRQDFDWAEIAGRFFHPREVEYIGELPESQRVDAFFRCWTMKEAFIKARGVGLQQLLLEIDFSQVVRDGRKDYTDTDGLKWLCVLLRTGEGLVASLVVESRTGQTFSALTR